MNLPDEIRIRARELGFDLVGFTSAEPIAHRDYLRAWLDSGQAGTMHWLNQRFEERTDPRVYLPGARTVICLAMNYHVPLTPPPTDQRVPGRIARYALGQDYHKLLKDRLYHLADWIRTQAPDAVTRSCVDTAPVAEKSLAARAGLGWIGKHTLLVHPRGGSWLLLGEIITTLNLPPDDPHIDRCGTCRRCIDACPTAAITAPYQLDARRCIAYLTIEQRQQIDPPLRSPIGDWLFGCDICQEVCPYNRDPWVTGDPLLQPRFASGTLDAAQVVDWSATDYQLALRHSAIRRVKLPVLQRNATVVLENYQRIKEAVPGKDGFQGW